MQLHFQNHRLETESTIFLDLVFYFKVFTGFEVFIQLNKNLNTTKNNCIILLNQ